MNMHENLEKPLSPAAYETRTIDQRILIAQASSLMNSAFSTWPISFIGTLSVWGIFYYLTRQPSVLVWATIMHTVESVTFLSARHYIKTPSAQLNPVSSANHYCKLLFLIGISWGLAPWIFLPMSNMPLTLLMTVVLLSVSSGGISALARYRCSLFSYNIPMLVLLACALLWQGDSLHLFLAICALLYLWINLRSGLDQNKFLTEALRARFEKEDLAQRLTEQVQLVKRASLEKTRFFASASHDLRQPLHSIGLFAAALLGRCESKQDEPLLHNLIACINTLGTSFNAMLDVSKLDAGVIEVNTQPLALTQLFQRLETSFGPQAEALGLALRFRPGGKWVYGDPILLERLLGNLMHNALKFTSHGGIVLVARTRGPCISVEVWDSGIGVDADDLSLIFDEFYQVGNASRNRSMGLGMGLSIVKRLTTLMNMPLTVHSKVGRGTVFKLLMPQGEPQHVQVPFTPRVGSNPAASSLLGKRVLVIDDEESVRNSTAAILRLHGMHVEMADGLPQALEIVLQPDQYPDVVITDLRLRHGENGIHLEEQLNMRLGRKLPVLLVTGDTAPERVQQVQQSGLRVLYKPVDIDDLLEGLSELLVDANAAG